MRRHLLVLFICACSLLPAGSSWAADNSKLHIVATTTQAADLTRILSEGLDSVQIKALMGAGVDPHLYQPTESDIVALNEAELLVYSGLQLEGQFDRLFAALSERGIRTVALSAPVQSAGYLISGYELSERLVDVDDPHFWFDPRNWQLSALHLAQVLAELDRTHAATYHANAARYSQQLDLFFDWAEGGLRSIDASQRYLVTSHDAFQYFGAAFGWQMQAIQGLSTEDEAGVGDIQQTVDFIIAQDIPVLFVESSVPPDTIEAVIAALRAQGKTARLGLRELYGDAMGAPDAFDGTYIGMLAHNALTILQSYRCMGVDVTIADWPDELEPQPPDELWQSDCSS